MTVLIDTENERYVIATELGGKTMEMSIYSYVLDQLYDTRPYQDRVIHHLLLTLACKGVDQNLSAALDTLTVAILRYGGRLREDTLAALADCLGAENAEPQTLVVHCASNSNSLVAIMNRKHLECGDWKAMWDQEINKYTEAMGAAEKRRYIKGALNTAYLNKPKYLYMGRTELVQELEWFLSDIVSGVVPSKSIPSSLIDYFGKTKMMKSALRMPYTLLNPDDLIAFIKEALGT